MSKSLFISILLLIVLQQFSCFYLPGVAPHTFQKGDPLDVKVTSLSSTKTHLPYDYYSLPFCKPQNRTIADPINLGEVLLGERILNTPYNIKMFEEVKCQAVCKRNFDDKQTKKFISRILDMYRANMVLDNLPAIQGQSSEQDVENTVQRGFELGQIYQQPTGGDNKTNSVIVINNHIDLNIKYHRRTATDTGGRIVAFLVTPRSIKHDVSQQGEVAGKLLDTCTKDNTDKATLQEGTDIIFSYGVTFQEDTTQWAQRWELYFNALLQDRQIHWFSIVNSIMIVLFLSGMLAMILLRALRKDISKYNDMEAMEDAQEETGWKLVHGDVFRAPQYCAQLAALYGSGAQIFITVLVTLCCATLGLLSPAIHGGLLTFMLVVYALMGGVGGFFSASLYKAFKGDQWTQMTLLTAFMFPGAAFGSFILVNLFVWHEQSSAAVPFGTLIVLLTLWILVLVPLSFVGAYLGALRPATENPVRTNKIPRQIPEQPWYMNSMFSCLIGGVLPFGAVFIELFFILHSIWNDQFYYLFSFLALVFVILIFTCAEISVVLCYFQLCGEDYRWWWRSFFTSGSSALYLFLYSAFYFYTKLSIDKFVPSLLYFTYMGLVSFGFFCLTGAIGFTSCYIFVRQIYTAVKID